MQLLPSTIPLPKTTVIKVQSQRHCLHSIYGRTGCQPASCYMQGHALISCLHASRLWQSMAATMHQWQQSTKATHLPV
jgi:hypothetical protein